MNEKFQPYAMLVARFLLALIFILSGMSKLAASDATRAYMEAMHVPGFLLWPTALFELGTGILLVVGYRTRFVSLLLAGFCFVTGFIFHNQFADQIQMVMFLKNIAMAGGFILLASVGAGHLSVDSKKGSGA